MAEGVVAGIDWASEVHVACVMDSDGLVTGRFSFTHDAAAIRAMAGGCAPRAWQGWRLSAVTARW